MKYNYINEENYELLIDLETALEQRTFDSMVYDNCDDVYDLCDGKDSKLSQIFDEIATRANNTEDYEWGKEDEEEYNRIIGFYNKQIKEYHEASEQE